MDFEYDDLSRLAWLEGLFTEWASTQSVSGADIVCRCQRDGCGNAHCAQLLELLRLETRWPTCHGTPMRLELACYDSDELELVLARLGRPIDLVVEALQLISATFLKAAAAGDGLTWQAYVEVLGVVFKTGRAVEASRTDEQPPS